MNVKTIALTGAEQAVNIGGSHAEIKNNGTDTIYASANSGIVAGADGVVSIPAGSAVTVLDTRGEVYLLGTGGAEIVGKDFVSQVFKPAATSGGGTTEDEVARNAINAHSGNAEIHVTAEEKAAWSAVNYSNPNLLTNPDFKVNQRVTSAWDYGTSLGYCVDCWKINSGSLSDSGLLVKGTAYLVQELEGDFKNKPLVLSVMYADGKMTDMSFVTGEGEWYYNMTGDGLFIEFGHKPQSNSYVSIHPLTNDVALKYAKLEIGSTATPFCPPNPATELAKCQRYYQMRSTGDIAAVDLRPSMRDNPTVTQLADGNYAYSAEL